MASMASTHRHALVQGSSIPDRTPECRAALTLLGGAGADGAVEACGGALFDDGDNLEVRSTSRRTVHFTSHWLSRAGNRDDHQIVPE